MEAEESALRPRRERAELHALAGATLAAVSRRARRLSTPVDIDLIGAWLALAASVPNPPPAIGLALTWTELLPEEGVDLSRPGELDRALRWLELVELLRRHAREQLREFGFPDRHRCRVTALAESAERLLGTPGARGLRPRLGQLLWLCRTLILPSRSDLALIDLMIATAADADDEPDREPAFAGGEGGARRHVGLILGDL